MSMLKMSPKPKKIIYIHTSYNYFYCYYSQVRSWHQLSCGAGSLDAFHEKHKLTVAAHYHQYQALHFALRKPEDENENFLRLLLLGIRVHLISFGKPMNQNPKLSTGGGRIEGMRHDMT